MLDGKSIESMRLARGLTREALARLCGISQRTLYLIESNSNKCVRLQTVERLANALGVDLAMIMIERRAPIVGRTCARCADAEAESLVCRKSPRTGQETAYALCGDCYLKVLQHERLYGCRIGEPTPEAVRLDNKILWWPEIEDKQRPVSRVVRKRAPHLDEIDLRLDYSETNHLRQTR